MLLINQFVAAFSVSAAAMRADCRPAGAEARGWALLARCAPLPGCSPPTTGKACHFGGRRMRRFHSPLGGIIG